MFTILFEQLYKEFILCFLDKPYDSFVSGIVYINIQLSQKHSTLFYFCIILPLFLDLHTPEQILCFHRWHIWTFTFPLSFQVYQTGNINVLGFCSCYILLLLDFSLFEFLDFCHRGLKFLLLMGVFLLLPQFALVHSMLAERDLLHQ